MHKIEAEHFDEQYIQILIDANIEESINLEFKEAGALGKEEKKKTEISKDIAAIANSDGGIIIYGIKELNYKANSLSFINGNEFTKEWLEQVIQSNIQRKIDDINISPIRFGNKIEQTVYVVKIPRSSNAPHMSKDKRFYKRYNFQSVQMEEYEVRQVYNRRNNTKLEISSQFYTAEKTEEWTAKKAIRFSIETHITNTGNFVENAFKCVATLKNVRGIAIESNRDDRLTYTNALLDNMLIISSSSSVPIFPGETINILKFSIEIGFHMVIEMKDQMSIEFQLYYSNGNDSAVIDVKQYIDKLIREYLGTLKQLINKSDNLG